MTKYLLAISMCCFFIACNENSDKASTGATAGTTSFKWTSLALPQVGGHQALLNKVAANKNHVFFAYRIPVGPNVYSSGLLIKDQHNQIKVLSDFSAPMQNLQKSAKVPGFVGKISALAAFEHGAWIATTTNGDAQRPDASKQKTLLAQIDPQGAFHSTDYADRSEILKLIPLSGGLLSLEYEGVHTPKLYMGDATTLTVNGVDWKNFKAFDLTASEMGDAALDMLVQPGQSPLPIVAVSGGGIYKGLVGASAWEKTWTNEPYAKPPVEIFAGAPNSMAFFQNKLAVGSFTHVLNPTTQSKGFVFCDLDKVTAQNPCESSSLARAKEYEIKKMIVFKDYLFMATPKGLLRFDGNELQRFTKANPKADLKDTNDHKFEAVGTLPGDDIIDLTVQDDVLWLITDSGVANLRMDDKN